MRIHVDVEIKDSIAELVIGAGVAAAGSYLLDTADPVVAGTYVLGMNIIGRFGDVFGASCGLERGMKWREKKGFSEECLGGLIYSAVGVLVNRGIFSVAGVSGAVAAGANLQGALLCEAVRLVGQYVFS